MADIIVQSVSSTDVIVSGVSRGEPGSTGPAVSLAIGSVTYGQQASATITGTAPNQQLNLVLPYLNVRTINQTGHGFNVGNLVYFNGTTYSLSRADNTANAEVIGMVSASIDTNNFQLATEGYIVGLNGLKTGVIYYLSPTVPGGMTLIEPTTTGQVSKPLFTADSTSTGYFHNYRGTVVA